MLNRQRLWVPVAIIAALVLLSSCSRAPSDDTIKSAIAELLKHQVPMSWSGSLMGGKNAQIELIEVKQVGKFNDQAKYWPIKARVKGTCQADLLFYTETRAFDRVGDFKLYQDDYGNWKASIEMMQ
jgi:hypothetical protein